MKYISVCTGLSAETLAWAPLGFSPVVFSEIAPFPCALLHHHYACGRPLNMPHPFAGQSKKEVLQRERAYWAVQNIPEGKNQLRNVGDMTSVDWSKYEGEADMLVGGTPCQDFSIAGKRQGLAGARSGLALAFIDVLRLTKARWFMWEQVPGVLSQNGGRDFGTILGKVAELGYGWAYRIFDAQYFGVPQRRQRVFLIGHSGDWRRAAQVLFEPGCVCGHTAPRREKKTQIAGSLTARAGRNGNAANDEVTSGRVITTSLTTMRGGPDVCNAQGGFYVASYGCSSAEKQIATALKGKNNKNDFESETFVMEETPQLAALSPGSRGISIDQAAAGMIVPATMFAERSLEKGRTLETSEELGYTLTNLAAGNSHGKNLMDTQRRVRRLTPTEAERLMGVPDGFTRIPWRGKKAEDCPDGPRYEVLGNSQVIDVVRWIGRRLKVVDDMIIEKKAL